MTANRKSRGLTKGRLQPFNCGHKGWGSECRRCLTGNILMNLSKEVLSWKVFPENGLPSYMKAVPNSQLIKISVDGFVLLENPTKFNSKELSLKIKKEAERLLPQKVLLSSEDNK